MASLGGAALRARAIALYRQALRAARRCPDASRRLEVALYSRHMFEDHRSAVGDGALQRIIDGEKEVARLVELLDMKESELQQQQQQQQQPQQPQVEEALDTAEATTRTASTTDTSATPAAAAPTDAQYSAVSAWLESCGCSHHLPALQAVEVTDALLQHVIRGRVDVAQFAQVLEAAGMPAGAVLSARLALEDMIEAQ